MFVIVSVISFTRLPFATALKVNTKIGYFFNY